MTSHFRFNALFWLPSITLYLTDSIISYGEYDIDLRLFGLRLHFQEHNWGVEKSLMYSTLYNIRRCRSVAK